MNSKTITILFTVCFFILSIGYVKPTNGGALEKESLTYNLGKREREKFALGGNTNRALIVLDNKIISTAEMGALKKEEVESFNIFTDKEEIAKYSSENYYGVVVIKLKKK